MTKECTSYLGISPVCDKCGKEIKFGDTVMQTFIGVVGKDKISQELGIIETVYSLIHVGCEKGN